MQSLLRLSTIICFLFLILFSACSKENEIKNSNVSDKEINNPGNNTNLSPDEAKMVGTWIATDFATDCYDQDTVYLQTWNNQQGYKSITLVLKNDFSYTSIDSFKIGGVLKSQGTWKLKNGFLEFGGNDQDKSKTIFKSEDNFETSVGYFYAEFSCGMDSANTIVKGYQMYRYNYRRL